MVCGTVLWLHLLFVAWCALCEGGYLWSEGKVLDSDIMGDAY